MNNKILIVDDEKNIRTTLSTFLLSSGFEVDVAGDGLEAVKKLKDDDYMLVLLDIRMHKMTGIQVLKEIRKQGFKNNVVMMTAYGTVENAVESMKLGALDFISKPFTLEELKIVVDNVIERQKLNESQFMSFKELLEFAKKCIINQDYEKAKEYLKKAISEDVNSPEPHNLLGVLAEYRWDFSTARKHYRAALDLDPAYNPASENLERISNLKYNKEGICFDEKKES
ncbi:MAG: response regulator [Actinobacteria bacterium]|nr:response regulator [Actinomycetota bacterium]